MSSLLFVFGMLFTSKAIQRGATPYSGTFYSNLCLGIVWIVIGLVHGEVAPKSQWAGAILVGGLFVLGQMFIFVAFRFGDVSVATPIFGVKILFVAILSSIIMGITAKPAIWLSAALATCGIAFVQWSPRGRTGDHRHSRTGLTVALTLLAATLLSFFDVLLQKWGAASSPLQYLPIVFTSAMLFSCVLIPWVDTLPKLRSIGGLTSIAAGSTLMAIQAMGMCIALAGFGDATRVNIVYALRGIWAVGLAWLLAEFFEGREQFLPRSVMLVRAAGAMLITAAVVTLLL